MSYKTYQIPFSAVICVGGATLSDAINHAKTISLYGFDNLVIDENQAKKLNPEYKKVVEFVYTNLKGEQRWRRVGVCAESVTHIAGFDLDSNQYRHFRKSAILGGKIVPVQ